MIYTPLTMKAMKVAYRGHHGQVDKAGVPYILHPVHIAEQMTDETTTCVALLHDLVEEETMYSIYDLAEKFPPEIVDAVRILTHIKGTDYYDYIRSLKLNPIAKAVKLAELDHELDEERYAYIRSNTKNQMNWWSEKYIRAKRIL